MTPRYRLSIADIVLRGCEREPPKRLLESMRAHRAAPNTPEEWGLSVASMPGHDEAAVLQAARQIRQSHYRVASVEAIHDMYGRAWEVSSARWQRLNHLSVVWDHNAHALILSSQEPTLDLAIALAGLFGPPKVNPYYDERRRSRASR